MSATLLSMFLNPQLYIVFFRIAQSFFAPFIGINFLACFAQFFTNWAMEYYVIVL